MSRRRTTGCCPGNGCGATVDRRLLPIKTTYFFLFAAAAVLHPYLAVYMKDLGLTPKETSIILTVAIAGSAVARAVLGALADAFDKHALLMAICCLASAAAHVGLYFTPPVNQNGTSSVTHELTARLLCGNDRMAICVAQENGGSDAWNDSEVEWGSSGVWAQREMRTEGWGSCSIQCCSVVDPTSRSGDHKLTSEPAMRDRASFRMDDHFDQSTESTIRRTFSGTYKLPGLANTSDSNLSRSCADFTNLTAGGSNWTLTFDEVAEVKDCSSVWIVDLPTNLTDAAAATGPCGGSEEWTQSVCTLRCQGGFDPYANATGSDGYGSGEFGTTFVMVCVLFFLVLFFLCPIFSIADSLVYAVLGERGKDFGRVRLWGTFSLGIFAVLSGLAMDALAKSGVTNVYLYPFVICISLLLVTAVLSCSIPAEKLPSLPSSDAPLKAIRITDLEASHGLSNGLSSSLVTLGSHLGQVGVTSFQSSDGGPATNESQGPGNARGSFVLLPQGDLERFAAAKFQADSKTFVAVIRQNSKVSGEFVAPKSANPDDLVDSVDLASENPDDSVPAKYLKKHRDSEESIPLKSPREFERSVSAKSSTPEGDPEDSGVPHKSQDPGPPSASMSHNFSLLLSNPIVVTIFVTVLVAGLILGQHTAFFFWYLKTLGASQLLLGLNMLVCCASEVALLFTSGRILQVVGYRRCLYLVFAVYGIRLLVNSFIRNPWVAIGTEMTQSLCNGLLFPAASLCVNDLAPPGMHGTVQGIIAALHWSVGNAIGSAIAGTLYESIGPQRMFQIFSCVSFVYGALLAVTLETLHRRKPTENAKHEPNLERSVRLDAPAEFPKANGSDKRVRNGEVEFYPMMLQSKHQHPPPE